MCYDYFYLCPLQLPLNVFLSQLLGLYAIYIQIYWWMPCVDGCKVMHYFPNNPQVATTLKKNDYPSSRSYQLPKSPSQRWASGALLFQAGVLIDSALCRASAGNLRCYEFMNVKVIWCAEEKISQHSSPSSGSYAVSTSEMFSEPLQWFGVRGNVRGWKVT